MTIRGLVQTEVCIGDIFQLGEAVVQISQPRQPCFKLSVRHGLSDLPLKMLETGYTGFYFRVLKEGWVSKTDCLTLISKDPKQITVDDANRIMYHEKGNLQGIRNILQVEALSASWRKALIKRLEENGSGTKEQ